MSLVIVKQNVILRIVHPNIRGSGTGKRIKQKYCCTGYVSFVITLSFEYFFILQNGSNVFRKKSQESLLTNHDKSLSKASDPALLRGFP